ncbi:beta-ketoacyl-ACP synthase II [Kiritimatiellaeota bacterium B1221]|nr:beta-ketoacyl-ACP synthase II [Kiritimatiellaeota bacterium B1221]
MNKVVITGMGVISPLGCTLDSFWNALLSGTSGVRRIQSFDASAYPVQIAAEVTAFDSDIYMPAKDAKKMDPFSQFGFAAAIDAWEDAGLNSDEIDSERAGVVMGCGTGGLHVAQKAGMALPEKGPKAFSPFMVSQLILNIVSGHIAIKYGLNGPNYVVTTACAGGNHALADAMDLIKRGEADVMLAGGCEGSINEMGVGSFSAMRALCRNYQDEPQRASRPFDADRCGFVMGEGAAVLVLESEAHAKKRGARIYAEIAGAGRTCDAHHIVAPDPEARQAARCMKLAMEKGGVNPEEVDYINAHGTSTVLNDAGETRAIHRAFGESAHRLSISSTKSMTGHLLAGAAAIEAVVSILAMNRGAIPPTINYETPDPACDLDITPNTAKEKTVKVALSNAFGFGGHNCCVLFKKD